MRKGFTLIEVMITLAVLAILAYGIIIGADEVVITAKATNIINNLQTLRNAVSAWYVDNYQTKVVKFDSNNPLRYAGTVLIGKKSQPIQQWSIQAIGLDKYLENGSNFDFNKNLNNGNYAQNQSTNLTPGIYGIYDGGSRGGRKNWYVGYCFQDNEEKVKQKLIKRAESASLFFTNKADPNDLVLQSYLKTKDGVNHCIAVWIKILSM